MDCRAQDLGIMPKPSRPPDFIQQAGMRLKAARIALNLSAKEVCEAINIQQNTCSQWETGKSMVDVAAAARLKKILESRWTGYIRETPSPTFGHSSFSNSQHSSFRCKVIQSDAL